MQNGLEHGSEAPETGDVAIDGAEEQIEGQTIAYVMHGGVAETGNLEIVGLQKIAGAVDAGLDVLADERHHRRRHASDEYELVKWHAQGGIVDDLQHRVPGIERRRQPVVLGDLAQPVEPFQAAGAGDVLEHNVGIPRDVPAQVTGKDSAFRVGSATRWIVVDHGKRLAREEFCGVRGGCQGHGRHEQQCTAQAGNYRFM